LTSKSVASLFVNRDSANPVYGTAKFNDLDEEIVGDGKSRKKSSNRGYLLGSLWGDAEELAKGSYTSTKTGAGADADTEFDDRAERHSDGIECVTRIRKSRGKERVHHKKVHKRLQEIRDTVTKSDVGSIKIDDDDANTVHRLQKKPQKVLAAGAGSESSDEGHIEKIEEVRGPIRDVASVKVTTSASEQEHVDPVMEATKKAHEEGKAAEKAAVKLKRKEDFPSKQVPATEGQDDSDENADYLGRLSLTKSDGSMRFFNIKRCILIGRGAECDIRIKVKTVSRVHCKVNLEANGDFVLENVSTTNFTIVNNTEVGKQCKLQDGDIITVAERDFIFQLIDNEPTAGQHATYDDEKQGNAIYSIFCGTPADGADEDGTCTVM